MYNCVFHHHCYTCFSWWLDYTWWTFLQCTTNHFLFNFYANVADIFAALKKIWYPQAFDNCFCFFLEITIFSNIRNKMCPRFVLAYHPKYLGKSWSVKIGQPIFILWSGEESVYELYALHVWFIYFCYIYIVSFFVLQTWHTLSKTNKFSTKINETLPQRKIWKWQNTHCPF